MKKQLLLVALLAASMAVNAQTEKRIRVNQGSEVNYTLAADEKTKDGVYFIKNTTNDGLWLQGRYTKGVRTGTWFMFDANKKLAARFSYDKKQFAFIDTAQFHNVNVRVLSNVADVVKNASIPMPICPVDYFTELATAQVYRDYAKRSEGFKAEITAHVNAQGKAFYSVVYVNHNTRTEPQRFELDLPFDIDWVPSLYQGKSVASEFTVFATVDPKGSDSYRRFRWDN